MTTSPSKKEIEESLKSLSGLAIIKLAEYLIFNHPELDEQEMISIALSNEPIEASTWLSN